MKLYRYWARGSAPVDDAGRRVVCHGGSNESVEDAVQRAEEIARRVARALESGVPRSYAYSDRPLREEVLERFSEDGHELAALTRNAYGAVVLNTAEALFADIDYPPRPPLGRRLKRVLGRLLGRASESDDERIVRRIGEVVDARPGLGLRVYRTAAGYRCLATSGTFSPTDPRTHELLEVLGCDPLYVKLCSVQECFRARVSPKPWRCGVPRPPWRFPFGGPDDEVEYREWERLYERQTSGFGTCILVAELGSKSVVPAVRPLMELHDRLACTRGDRLA